MNSRSNYRVVARIVSETVGDCFEAVNSSAFAEIFSMYSMILWKCGQKEGKPECGDVKLIEMNMSIATAYFSVFMRFLKAIKPRWRKSFIFKGWDGLSNVAEMHVFLLNLFFCIALLIKVGHFEKSGEDDFSKIFIDNSLLTVGGVFSAVLTVLSNNKLRNVWDTDFLRTKLDKISDGIFGWLEGFAVVTNLGSVFQDLHDIAWDTKTSRFSLISISTRFSVAGAYGAALGYMDAKYPLAERERKRFSHDIKSLAFVLNGFNDLFYSIYFGILLGEELQSEVDPNRLRHIIAFGVLLGISILKNILLNCCYPTREEISEESYVGDSAVIPQEGYYSRQDITSLDFEEETPSPISEKDAPFTSRHSPQKERIDSEHNLMPEEIIPQRKKRNFNLFNFFKSFRHDNHNSEVNQDLLSDARMSQVG